MPLRFHGWSLAEVARRVVVVGVHCFAMFTVREPWRLAKHISATRAAAKGRVPIETRVFDDLPENVVA